MSNGCHIGVRNVLAIPTTLPTSKYFTIREMQYKPSITSYTPREMQTCYTKREGQTFLDYPNNPKNNYHGNATFTDYPGDDVVIFSILIIIITDFYGAYILRNLSSEAQQNRISKRNRKQGRAKVSIRTRDNRTFMVGVQFGIDMS